MVQKPSKIQPALLGGLVVGLCSVIPGLSYGNFCCCGWGIVGGALAAYLLKRRSTLPLTAGDGAAAGALAGVVGSVIYLVIGVPLSLLQWPAAVAQMEQRSDAFDDLATRQMFNEIVGTMREHPVLIILGVWLVFAVVATGMSAIGGMIGVKIFDKRKPQEYPPEEPPAAPGYPPGYAPPGPPSGGPQPPAPPIAGSEPGSN